MQPQCELTSPLAQNGEYVNLTFIMHEPASESLQSKLEESHSLSCGCPKKTTSNRCGGSKGSRSSRSRFNALKWPQSGRECSNRSPVQRGSGSGGGSWCFQSHVALGKKIQLWTRKENKEPIHDGQSAICSLLCLGPDSVLLTVARSNVVCVWLFLSPTALFAYPKQP